MAVASTAPIQIGRYRSPSTSRRSTIGWLLGSSTRTPTTLSSRTVRLRVVSPPRTAAPNLHGTRTPSVSDDRGTPPFSGRVPPADRFEPVRRADVVTTPAGHARSPRHGPEHPDHSAAPAAPATV